MTKYLKDFDTNQGFTAGFVVLKEIIFNPQDDNAVIVLDLYKSELDYEEGKALCESFHVKVKDAAYQTFINSSEIYTKAENYLKQEGNLLDGATNA